MAWNVEKLTSLPRGLVLLVAVSVLGLGGAFGARPAQASGGVLVGSVTLSPIPAVVNTPIGIDYHEPSGKLLLSVNYGTGGIPYNFDLVAADGSHVQFGSIGGIPDEVYIATVRSSSCTGGFTVGQSFVGNGVPGQVLRLDSAGNSLGVFVDLSAHGDSGLLRGGLFQDRYCAFGGKLVVTTTHGNVWLVDSTGSPTLLASGLGPTLEGPTTVPIDPRYGPWSGAVVVTEETFNAVISVDAFGNARYWYFGNKAEGVHVIPANQDFYGIDYAAGHIVRGQASQFASIVGDILLTNEDGVLQHIYWDSGNAVFVVEDIAQVGQFEGSTFAPLTDGTLPKAQCIETTNPSGKNVPTSGANAGDSGSNPDAFYQLFGTDNVAVASIVVKDTGSSFISKPFASGDKVKITQALGATPSDTRPGPGGIVSQLKLKGDALLTVTDTSGNVATALCKVAPLPK